MGYAITCRYCVFHLSSVNIIYDGRLNLFLKLIMTPIEAKKLVLDLMTEHKLLDDGWYFRFNNSRTIAGQCNHTYKEINLSKFLLPHMLDSSIKNTILHEIAHALVGYSHGHDSVWRRKALEIGCDGNRCYNQKNSFKSGSKDTIIKSSKYNLTCKTCGYTVAKHRKPKNDFSCSSCNPNGFNPDNLMVLTKNY